MPYDIEVKLSATELAVLHTRHHEHHCGLSVRKARALFLKELINEQENPQSSVRQT